MRTAEAKGFTERAQQIFDAAMTAAANGEARSEITILIGQEGGIQMLANSDWPLDSLLWQHGASAAYRVLDRAGLVRVEARSSGQTCVLEAPAQKQIARWLLG